MNGPEYLFMATLDRVVDGDTVDLWVDLGFRVKIHQRFRLSGIDAPERFTDSGKLATKALNDLLSNKTLLVKSTKLGKYGRWVGTIWVDGEQVDISRQMVELGFAELKEY